MPDGLFWWPRWLRLLAITAASVSIGVEGLSNTSHQPAPREGTPEDEEEEHLCKHGIGSAMMLPNIPDHLAKPHPKIYNVAIPLVSVAAVATAAISVPHLTSLCVEVKPDLVGRGHLTRVVAAVPVVIAGFKMLAVLMPRIWKFLFFLAAIYEVVAFGAFMRLIMNLVADHDGWTDKEVLEHFQKAEPSKIWAVPPLGCCFKPCACNIHLSRSHLNVLRGMMWQFVIICPLVAASEMSEHFESHEEQLTKFETLSLVIAMYALFQLLEATHEMLHDKHCHSKFWTIKGTFIANTAIFRACSHQVTQDVIIGKRCYSSGAMAAAWSGMITAMLCVPLALLSRHAYQRSDLVHVGESCVSTSEVEEEGNEEGSRSGSSE